MGNKDLAFSTNSIKNGRKYYLHAKEVTLAGSRKQTIYYFAQEPTEFAITYLPEGYEVIEIVRTGLPMLKKKR